MTLTEFCLLTITIFMAAMTVSLIIVVTRVLPLLMSAQRLTEEITITTKKLDGSIVELTGILQEHRATQTRVNGILSLALDQVGPPLKQMAAILSGVRAGLGALTKR